MYFVISFSVHNPFWYAETQGIKTKSSTAFDYITSVYEQKKSNLATDSLNIAIN